MEKIFTYTDLLKIPLQERKEELVIVQETVPEIICKYKKQDMIPYLGEKMLLRKTVATMLKNAATELDKKRSGAKLLLVYAYRHPNVQKMYFDQQITKIKKLYPDMDDDIIKQKAHKYSASPDVAGHPSGACVDITITTHNGELDMGTGVADFNDLEKIRTFYPNISKQQKENRLLLRDIMLKANFAPYDMEWWHFSYGDRDWAAYFDEPFAFYGPITIKKTDKT